MFNNTTARVDIQRLQILNDRLCQTLDALNQVRLSAHSLNYGPYTQGLGQWNTQGLGQWNTLGGYSHTPFFGGYNYGIPQTVAPFAHGIGGINGFGVQAPIAQWGMTPAFRPSFTTPMNGGFGMTETYQSPVFAHASQPVMY